MSCYGVPLIDTKIKALRPKLARYRVSDTGAIWYPAPEGF